MNPERYWLKSALLFALSIIIGLILIQCAKQIILYADLESDPETRIKQEITSLKENESKY